MVRYVIDHEAVRLERFKGSVRFWSAIGLILVGGAGYVFFTRDTEAGGLIAMYVGLAVFCFAIVLWQVRRFSSKPGRPKGWR